MSRLVIELRAGEGGQDAEAFSSELRSAIVAFARKQRHPYEIEPLTAGARTLVVRVTGPLDAYARLAGVHRIQRVPKNDRRGRRHTSTATIAVLEDVGPVAVKVDDADLKVQAYRGTGNGGQKRNKTSSAARVRHLPTGLVVEAEEQRSLTQNRLAARARIESRLRERATQEAVEDLGRRRNSQIASAERPAKGWTHNRDQRGEVLCHATGERWRWADFYRGDF